MTNYLGLNIVISKENGSGKAKMLHKPFPITFRGRGHLRQPATIDPKLDLCTRYSLCGIQSLPDMYTS